jgi:anti-anti-sigma factor
VIVDLSGVDFLASMGVRLLLSNAKALGSRGGKMVIERNPPKRVNLSLDPVSTSDPIVKFLSDE